MKRSKQPNIRGFTIVELLIVVVIIAVLATITVIAFNGVQQRARDSQRMHDMATIVKALEMYKLQTGNYPAAIGNSIGGWEVSSNPNGNHPFLEQLVTAGVISKVPVDPVNTGDMATSNAKIYAYYRYSAGYAGCDASKGPYYVLLVKQGESTTRASSSPHTTCGTYAVGGYWWAKQSYTE